MKLYDMLDNLENISGSLSKEQYLIKMLKECPEAEKFFRFVFNDSVYGIKEQSFYNAFKQYSSEETFESVSDFLYSINKRIEPIHSMLANLYVFGNKMLQESGQTQLNSIHQFFEDLGPQQAKWWCRALLHDLRAGVQVKTINKVFKATNRKLIQKFSLQLAKKLDANNKEAMLKYIPFPRVCMETKYDGIRIQAHICDNQCQLMSRRGNDRTDSYPEIVEELKRLFINQNIILDGEVVASSFQHLMRKNDKSTRKYVIFDILNDENLPYKYRWNNLKSLLSGVSITDSLFSYKSNINNHNNKSADPNSSSDNINNQRNQKVLSADPNSPADNINNQRNQKVLSADPNSSSDNINNQRNQKVLSADPNSPADNINNHNNKSADLLFIAEHYNCGNIEELMDFYNEMNRRKEEGVIIKLDNCIYERGSRRNMFKLKKVHTADLKIIGYRLGEGKRAGKVATLELQDASKQLRVDVGSGIDDATCEELTQNPSAFVGKICEIRYNEYTETGSLRFPAFICIRDDKEEPDDLSEDKRK